MYLEYLPDGICIVWNDFLDNISYGMEWYLEYLPNNTCMVWYDFSGNIRIVWNDFSDNICSFGITFQIQFVLFDMNFFFGIVFMILYDLACIASQVFLIKINSREYSRMDPKQTYYTVMTSKILESLQIFWVKMGKDNMYIMCNLCKSGFMKLKHFGDYGSEEL